MNQKELVEIKINKPDNLLYEMAKKKWDSLSMPLDGLGDFEHLICKIAAIYQNINITSFKKALIVMCSDNGIVSEGVSQCGQDITSVVAKALGEGTSTVCKLAKKADCDVIAVDIGINNDNSIEGILDKRVRNGSRSFILEPAMTLEETLEAINHGIQIVNDLKSKGYNLIATGEMGIGNTTTSSALCGVLLNKSALEITGRGAGLDDLGLNRKREIVDKGISLYDKYKDDPLRLLSSLGGYDIAGMCGVYIGCAIYNIPCIIDGLISAVAALLAEKIVPGCKAYMIPSHKGREKALSLVLNELELIPLVNGNMALGEGTGAVMLMPLLDMALALYSNGRTFEEAGMTAYERYN